MACIGIMMKISAPKDYALQINEQERHGVKGIFNNQTRCPCLLGRHEVVSYLWALHCIVGSRTDL